MAEGLTYSIEDTATEDGLMWRAIGRDSYGMVTEWTRWTSTPVRANRDLLRLVRNEYWCDGGGDPHRGWVTAA